MSTYTPLARRLRKARRPLPAPKQSACVQVELTPKDVALFRFLLESYENLAGFTVLDRKLALLKVFFSPHQHQAVMEALAGMGESIPLRIKPWPKASDIAMNSDAYRADA